MSRARGTATTAGERKICDPASAAAVQSLRRYTARPVVCTLPVVVLKHSLAAEGSSGSRAGGGGGDNGANGDDGVDGSGRSESAVEFRPPLSARKRRAIAGLGMGAENKCVLRFDRPFWPVHCPYLQTTDQRFRFINLHYFGKAGVIVAHIGPV